MALALGQSALGAAGAYYAPRIFKGVMEIGDGLFRVGADKICDATGLCTVGALSRKEKRQLDNYVSNKMPSSMMRSSGAVASFRNGTVQAHVAATRKLAPRAPRFKSVSGKTVITHSEFVSTAGSASGGFITSIGFRANPTDFTMFPWLAPIAGNFDKYRFTSLSFEYIPLMPTTQAGRVGLIFDYDSQDALPTIRADCYSYQHSVEGPVWDRLLLKVKTDSVVRYTDFGSTTDFKLIDLGQMIIFSDATSASLTLGDVLVHYTVELIEPQPNPVGQAQVFTQTTGAGVIAASSRGSPLVSITSGSWSDFTFAFNQIGAYIISFEANGGASGMTGTVTVNVGTNITIGTQNEAVSATDAVAWFIVLVKQPLSTIRIHGFGSSTPGTEQLVVSRFGFGDFF